MMGERGEGREKKNPPVSPTGKVSCYAFNAESRFASFAFLLAALFLWRIPLETAESIADTVTE